jgi:hypothetical protein
MTPLYRRQQSTTAAWGIGGLGQRHRTTQKNYKTMRNNPLAKNSFKLNRVLTIGLITVAAYLSIAAINATSYRAFTIGDSTVQTYSA